MSGKDAYLIGICGTAMASLAGLLKGRGYRVRGSDAAAYPPMSDFLKQIGVEIRQPYAETNLEPKPDLVVVGNAISRGNPELEVALDAKVPLTSLPHLLKQEFLAGRESLVVAGTHGKTTTTSMLAWIFEVAGLEPSFLVGGIAENFGSSFADTNGRYFIVEGDEYDSAFFDKGPKFLHYFPDGLILTSVEFDHADIYKDLEAVKTAFKRLVNLVPRRGVIVAYDADANVTECLASTFCQVQRYGFGEDSFWRVTDLKTESGKTSWSLHRKGELWAKLSFDLAGEFNVLNATAAAALASHYGVRPEQVREALAAFKSVKRRMEVRGVFEGVTIIDDFAHHPTAIAQTLKALRSRYPHARLWAICEPRSNTLRRKVFEKELAESLAIADEVILAAVFRSEAIAEGERLSPEAVIQALRQQGKPARLLADADVIAETVAPELSSGDVVAILSNGGFGNIYEKLPQRLKSRHEVQVRK